MSKFESESFSRSFNEGSNMKQYVIGEPEMYEGMGEVPPAAPVRRELTPEERQEYFKKRQMQSGQSTLGGFAKTRIEILANIGRLTKEVDIDGIKFGFRTLKSKELREAMEPIFSCKNDVEAHFEMRRHVLARSIFQLDGQPIEVAIGSSLDVKLNLIDELEEAVATKLYNEYKALKDEADKKYGVANEVQAKEVLDDLKK